MIKKIFQLIKIISKIIIWILLLFGILNNSTFTAFAEGIELIDNVEKQNLPSSQQEQEKGTINKYYIIAGVVGITASIGLLFLIYQTDGQILTELYNSVNSMYYYYICGGGNEPTKEVVFSSSNQNNNNENFIKQTNLSFKNQKYTHYFYYEEVHLWLLKDKELTKKVKKTLEDIFSS